MAVAEGYVMARNRGCMPFVKSVRDFLAEYEPEEPAAENATAR